MRLIFSILMLGLALSAHADIYEHETNGNTSYSDTANSESKPVNTLEETSTISMPNKPTAEEKNENSLSLVSSNKKPYTVFAIISPKTNETFQNRPIISVELKIEPELQTGDKIQLILDNKPLGEPAIKTEFALNEVDRGSHTLQALLVDSGGKTLKQTEVITIFVHKTTITLPPGTN